MKQYEPKAQSRNKPENHLETADWISFLTGEMLVVSLLSKTLYNYPTQAWLQTLAIEDVFAEAPLANTQPDVQNGLSLLQVWTQTARAGITSQAFDDLRVDYTRLMIGPDRVLAPPWESVYYSEERLVFNAQTSQVRAWYLRFQLEVENRYQEPDDHLGLELAFVAHLARQALVALNQDDLTTFENLIAAQREFLANHLSNWGPEWCNLAYTHAHTDFLRGIALLTKGILAEIATVLQIESATTAP